MEKKKTVLLGVSGGIAAYKSASLASMLIKDGYDVEVLMTKNAENFINPIVFETLTGHKCLVDTFDRNFEFKVEHVAVAQKADAVIIAPATANVIAKLAHGIADDMLTTTVLACRTCPKLISPAMNTEMYLNPVVQDNLEVLRKYGWQVIEPAEGHLACGDTGAGKMPEPEVLRQYIYQTLAYEKDMKGKKVLVTAGPTQEAIDPVRYITNHSSGKMGYAIARVCAARGAQVTLVTGQTALEKPLFAEVVPVVSAEDMYEAVVGEAADADIVIKAAAVADYRPKHAAGHKMKKKDEDLSIELERTHDILAALGESKKPGQFLCGFSMETENLIENSVKKLEKKNLDMIAANSLKTEGAGFKGDTNMVTLITKDSQIQLPLLSKEETAARIIDRIMECMEKRRGEIK